MDRIGTAFCRRELVSASCRQTKFVIAALGLRVTLLHETRLLKAEVLINDYGEDDKVFDVEEVTTFSFTQDLH